METVYPKRSALLAYLQDCGAPYWQGNKALLDSLRIREVPPPRSSPLQYGEVTLPDWAAELGVGGKLLVPQCVVGRPTGSGNPSYLDTDWWQAAFLMLSCWDEFHWEQESGPTHSYSYRMKSCDSRVWERAWVNRIFLFLRRWAAREVGRGEMELFGPLPQHEIMMTHDLDAISKTLAIRLKAMVFLTYHAFLLLLRGAFGQSSRKLLECLRWALAGGDYWSFDRIRELEKQHAVRSHFYVYGGPGGWRRSFRQMLFDPAYEVEKNPRLVSALRELHEQGCSIGLHQSFDAWKDARLMIQERQRLETVLNLPVISCRQHWLRFSLQQTWRAQSESGLRQDGSFGFNDRPGFRGGSALRIRPWSHADQRPHQIEIVPLAMMDSHFYQYQSLDDASRYRSFKYWLDEIKAVCGTASVVWHPHVLSRDYGWENGMRDFLSLMTEAPGN
ncbi:MAG: hypothetical protein L0387_37140 [Acidobacteria bacterium]|nr:hypothetical protein [Acidobacteriota bacterium]MCI0723633.1 hypothetical protein [Acidobacteriota bacterium]